MKKNSAFEKFLPKKKNSVIKEEARQFKKKIKKERAEAIDKRKAETRARYAEGQEQRRKNPNQAPGSKPVLIKAAADPGIMPINKFIAHCGVTSRREAAELVRQGKVKVNGELILEPGHKVSAADDIKVAGKKVFLAKNLVYILINKPKDYITTSDDPQGRKTILDLIKGATPERIFPVGRLDRNTTGVLLLTNDGELTQKLTHPSYEVKKIYEVTLDKPVTKADFDKILSGMELEDGFIRADALAYTNKDDHSTVGIEIHSGRNRIVRRVFEALGYDVRNLDRVMFANLTKKNVERGKWRFLNEKEVRLLKYMNSSFIRKNKVGSDKLSAVTEAEDVDLDNDVETPAPAPKAKPKATAKAAPKTKPKPAPEPREMSTDDEEVDLAQLWEKKRGGKPIAPREAGEGEESPRPKRSYARKDKGDRKPYGERKSYGDKKPYGERESFGEKRSFSEKKPYGDRKPFGEKKSFGDKKSYGDRKPFGEKKSFGDKKSYGDRKPFGEKKSFGDKKPYSDRKPFGEKKSWGDKPAWGEKRSFGEKKSFGDRKPFGEKKAWGDKPYARKAAPPSRGPKTITKRKDRS